MMNSNSVRLSIKKISKFYYREVFSRGVTSVILGSQNNETMAMLLSQTNPVGVKSFSYVKLPFFQDIFAWVLST